MSSKSLLFIYGALVIILIACSKDELDSDSISSDDNIQEVTDTTSEVLDTNIIDTVFVDQDTVSIDTSDVIVGPVIRRFIYVITDDNKLYVSNDHGVNWSQLQVPRISSYSCDDKLFDVVFKDSLNGVVITDCSRQLYKTTDGGNTWERSHVTGDLSSSSIGDNEYIETSGGDDLFISTQYQGQYSSTDFGITWFMTGDSEANKREASYVNRFDYFMTVRTTPSSDYKLSGPTNSGFQGDREDINLEFNYRNIEFVSLTTGYAFPNEYDSHPLYKTTNRGESWEPVNIQETLNNPTCLFFLNDEEAYSTSVQKFLMYTSTGGNEWIPIKQFPSTISEVFVVEQELE